MKTAVVIGGYGHIGSYLVPELVKSGYDVTVVSRGNRKPYNAELLYEHFGHDPKLRYMPFAEFREQVAQKDAIQTYEHISRSPACSMEKAEKLLGFVPRYSSIDTVISSLDYKIKRGEL